MAKGLQRTPENQRYRDNLAHDLKRFRSYGDTWRELANVLLKAEKENPEYIKSQKYSKESALKLIEEKDGWFVAGNIDKFEKAGQKEIVEMLIKRDYWWLVFENIDKIKELFNKDVMKFLCKKNVFHRWVMLSLEKFEWLNQEVAEYMVEKGYSWIVLDNLDNFKWLNHKKLAEQIIDYWDWEDLIDYLKNLKWLDGEVAKKLVEEWYWKYVERNPEYFWLKKDN